MIDLITFDLDGTLVDTAGEIVEAANLTLVDFGQAPQPRPLIEGLIGTGAHSLMLQLLTRVDPQQQLDRELVLARFELRYAETAGTAGQPYADVLESLQRLRADGVRLACVTNKERRHAQHVLEVTALADCFELLIGGDTLAWKKPDPRVLQHVIAQFGSTPARTAHVGDSAIDLGAARSAGVADWAVPWGYNAGRPIEQDQPTRLFHSFPRLADHVLALRHADEPSRDLQQDFATDGVGQ
ncbi:MAG: HAD-IA family hydrolase [Rhodanobacter sp.]